MVVLFPNLSVQSGCVSILTDGKRPMYDAFQEILDITKQNTRAGNFYKIN